MILTIVREWLESLQDSFFLENADMTELAILEAVKELGYGAPFDHEQRAINNLLLEKRANKLACLIAWGYYHDAKLIEAHAPQPKAQVKLAS